MKNLLRLSALALLASLATTACSHDNSIASFRAMPREGWLYGDSVVLMPEMAEVGGDSVAEGELLLSVRHDNSYPFANLWVEVTVSDRLRDTLEVRMADVYGNWHGRASGVSVSLTDTVARRIALRAGQPVSVRHIMRPDTLPGVERVGLIFNPFENEGF